ncbi:MAG: ATP-dependent sacrificial sulfur transferase LarE [Eubacterium sp.]|nr:ATP-dependent sacrificial sulfur transferase LarE [Eubacterium sp.]
MEKELEKKYEKLVEILEEMESAVVAFSAGVDSTFLLHVAHKVMKEHVLAVTVITDSFPQRELEEANVFLKNDHIPAEMIRMNQLEIDGFQENTEQRCYFCKKAIFGQIRNLAEHRKKAYVLDGSNVDDDGDYRPGMKALKELGIRSPLKEAGMTKNDIRRLSEIMGLKTWDKPAYACLATRIKSGQKITLEKLKRIELAEQYLIDRGFRQVRVRLYENETKIEVETKDIPRLKSMEKEIVSQLESLELQRVSIDPEGYVMGKMNGGKHE